MPIFEVTLIKTVPACREKATIIVVAENEYELNNLLDVDAFLETFDVTWKPVEEDGFGTDVEIERIKPINAIPSNVFMVGTEVSEV